jgi:hypothetical protein
MPSRAFGPNTSSYNLLLLNLQALVESVLQKSWQRNHGPKRGDAQHGRSFGGIRNGSVSDLVARQSYDHYRNESQGYHVGNSISPLIFIRTPALKLRRTNAGRQRVLTRGQGASSSSSRHPVTARFLKRRQNRRSRRRRVQDDVDAEDDENFLVLFGGDVSGTYSGSLYQATWNGNFFLMFDDSGQSEPAYAADLGDGARALPVMYFPPNITVSGTDFPHRTTEDDARKLGGVYGYLSVVARDSFQETPRTAGGRIVPIIYAEASIDGGSFSVYVGGFNGTVFDWGNADNDVSVRTLHWQTALAENEALGLKHVIVDIAAYDYHATTEGASPNETLKGFDYELFVYPGEEESGAAASWNWSMTILVTAMLLLAFPLL